MDVLLIYAGLFASAFLAATILPAQSELGLAAFLSMGTLPTFWLIAVASIGNILGAVVNWVLARSLNSLNQKMVSCHRKPARARYQMVSAIWRMEPVI